MFGKKGGVLGSWIKEFCTLVFIQTIQAFIYAIIISVIFVITSIITVVNVKDSSCNATEINKKAESRIRISDLIIGRDGNGYRLNSKYKIKIL